MKKIVLMAMASAVAASVFAEEEEETTEASAPVAAKVVSGKTLAVPFMVLPQCSLAESPAEVRLPGGEWESVEEGRHYPLGASYRTRGKGKFELKLGEGSKVKIEGDAAFGTRIETLGSKTRTIVPEGGLVELDLADNMPEGAMQVATSGFLAKNLAGKSRFDYADRGDGDEVTVRCVTGTLSVDGRHFEIVSMHAADEFRIRSSRDFLMTIIYGNSGDIAMKLDQGVGAKRVVGDDGSITETAEKSSLDWRLSPKTKVVISRARPAIGERMSVHTMTFDAAGERKNECAFCEGRAEVNSGELIEQPKPEADDLAKRAAEATETTSADAEETSTEQSSDGEATSSDSSSTDSAE